MTPERKETINGHTVEEFYWAGGKVVYVDHWYTELTFDEVKGKLLAGEAVDKVINRKEKP